MLNVYAACASDECWFSICAAPVFFLVLLTDRRDTLLAQTRCERSVLSCVCVLGWCTRYSHQDTHVHHSADTKNCARSAFAFMVCMWGIAALVYATYKSAQLRAPKLITARHMPLECILKPAPLYATYVSVLSSIVAGWWLLLQTPLCRRCCCRCRCCVCLCCAVFFIVITRSPQCAREENM